MTELNENSVADALLYCYNCFNLKVCIAFSSHKRMYDFAMSLQIQQREGLVPATHYKHGVNEIFFDSGSSIRMVDASDPKNLYGLTFHKVLYDPDINEGDVLTHLKSCERWPWSYYPKPKPVPEMEIDNQPLDDFLNGFSVIKT